MATIISIPPEIIIKFYEGCQTFTDAVNLSSCCRWLRSVWNGNQDALAFRIALQVVPAFDDALITIRATAAAKSNLVNYILNQEIPTNPILIPSSFSYHVSKPRFPEIVSVVSLFKLIDCALFTARYGDLDQLRELGSKIANPTWTCSVPYDIFGGVREPSPAYNYRVFSSMYRVFLAGAVLSWQCIYPIIKEDSPLRERFLPKPGQPRPRMVPSPAPEGPQIYPATRLDETEIAYLKQFLPFQLYNMGQSRNPNPTSFDDFHPLAEYLIQKGRDEFEFYELGPESTEVLAGISTEDHKQGSAIQQFMMLQNAYEIFRRVVADEIQYDAYMDRVGYDPEPSPPNPEKDGQPDRLCRRASQIELFMFGCYQPETFYFPSRDPVLGDRYTPQVYVGPGTYEEESSSAKYLWETLPITKLMNELYPSPAGTRGHYVRQCVDSYFVIFCVQKLLDVRFNLSDWLHEISARRAMYMIEGRAFRESMVFVPNRDLLKFPLYPNPLSMN
ncbi:hypothetical protein TWF718_002356 [Orbilia javanica]|uniref:Uncharacterized protein n=1 Tax=Orbilia javanica TaxID=47235 RepID=A0AAN8RCB1_9PEZI